MEKKGNVLFNNSLNTFYLRLCGISHMVKDHSDNERGNPLPPHGLLFTISSNWLERAASGHGPPVPPPTPPKVVPTRL